MKDSMASIWLNSKEEFRILFPSKAFALDQMISISTDNSEIFQLLEDTENLHFNFSADGAFLFEVGEDCYLVLYSASTRNFCSFKAENWLQLTDALPSLLETVQDYNAHGFSPSLVATGARLVENKLHSKNNSRFFFDAH